MIDCIRIFIIVVLLGALPFKSGFAADKLDGPVTAEVLRIIDGDTFDVRVQTWVGQYVETRVRLNGIDTPEIRAKCISEKHHAERAKTVLSQLLATNDNKIILYNIENGKYAGRVLASAKMNDGTDISNILIHQGYARPYHGEKREGWCSAALSKPEIDNDGGMVARLFPATGGF